MQVQYSASIIKGYILIIICKVTISKRLHLPIEITFKNLLRPHSKPYLIQNWVAYWHMLNKLQLTLCKYKSWFTKIETQGCLCSQSSLVAMRPLISVSISLESARVMNALTPQ